MYGTCTYNMPNGHQSNEIHCGHHGLFTNSKTFYIYMHKVKNIVVLSQSLLTHYTSTPAMLIGLNNLIKAFTVKLLDSDTHRQTWYKHNQ